MDSLDCCSELFTSGTTQQDDPTLQRGSRGYYMDAGKCFSTSGGIFNGSSKIPMKSQGLSVVLRYASQQLAELQQPNRLDIASSTCNTRRRFGSKIYYYTQLLQAYVVYRDLCTFCRSSRSLAYSSNIFKYGIPSGLSQEGVIFTVSDETFHPITALMKHQMGAQPGTVTSVAIRKEVTEMRDQSRRDWSLVVQDQEKCVEKGDALELVPGFQVRSYVCSYACWLMPLQARPLF